MSVHFMSTEMIEKADCKNADGFNEAITEMHNVLEGK